MSAPRMTAVFECDIQKIEGNPFHIETPFGKAISVGIGDAFSEIEELEARADLCDPTQDERVKALVEAAKRLADMWDKDAMDRIGPATRQVRAVLRDMGVE